MRKLLYIFLLIPLISYAQKSNDDFGLHTAIREIRDQYGDIVTVKPKSLLKFGRNSDVSTVEETVWNVGGKENYPTGNDITNVSSSNSGDTVTMKVEGHTKHGDNIYFRVQDVTLTGQTTVSLDSPLYRITRMYNNSTVDLEGDVYAYRAGTTVSSGVPQEADSIHIKVESNDNQSLKASTALSTDDYWLITQIRVSVGVSSNNTRKVQFRLHVREQDKVFRTRDVITTANDSGIADVTYNPPLIIRPGSDIHIDALSSGTGTECSVSINGFLAKKQ